MNKERKKLSGAGDFPRLEEAQREQYERFSESRKIKLRKWYLLYISTTVSVVILAAVMLLLGIGSDDGLLHGGLLSEKNVRSVSGMIIGSDFRDLSGQKRNRSYGEKNDNDIEKALDVVNGILLPSSDKSDNGSVLVEDMNNTALTYDALYKFDYSKVPDGETAIIPMDLSLSSYGSEYIYNTTGYEPDISALLSGSLSGKTSPVYLAEKNEPLVLIVHTHGTEAYSPDGATSYADNGGEIARSTNISENVVAVGEVISSVLNQNGIPTVHCTIMHDQIQYKDSYLRAEETIREYLEKYPSIKLVIDVHRDSIVKSTGELVRPVTLANGQAAAQVMCVVGSDWGGESCPNWQGNLALALKLRDKLNISTDKLCRPAYLRSSTYNQEIAPYSLLLEIGASGNSLNEAKVSAKLVADALTELIRQM